MQPSVDELKSGGCRLWGKRDCATSLTAKKVIDWQNQIRKEGYSDTYLRTIHNQLYTLFNHAVRFYGLKQNPAFIAGSMGAKRHAEMKFWTKSEYLRFVEVMMDKPIYYYAFEILYWCGIRIGELLALTPSDFNYEKKTLRIDESYQRLKGSISHNNRKFVARNVDEKRVKDNIVLCREYLKDVYDDLFGAAMAEYNAKQKRKDRRIENYLDHIINGKQEKPFYELVF